MNEQPSQDRRSFLKTMGASSALAVTVPALWSATSADAGAAAVSPGSRGYVAGKYAIELDGVMAGWVQSFDGGGASAEVVEEKTTEGQFAAKKHISNVKYEGISISCGTGMSKGFYQWIKDSMDGKAVRISGGVRGSIHQKFRLNFTNALITEIGFPALDAASKDAAKMTIKFSPESSRRAEDTGAPPQMPFTWPWLASRFILEIDGLDCSRVSKIDAFVVKQTLAETSVGTLRDYQKEPAKIEFPNISITLPESASGSFQDWFDDFVIKGNNDDKQEKSGTLSWMTADGKLVLGVVEFSHLGIFRLAPDASSTDGIRRVKAELYCESMAFDFSATSA